MMPDALELCGCVVTSDDRYILVFGGQSVSGGRESDSIYVVDTLDMSIIRPIVRCPEAGPFQAFLCHQKETKGALLSGFIRKCSREWKQPMSRYPSAEVLDTICAFYDMATVYVHHSGRQWKMDLQSVFGRALACNKNSVQ